MATPAAILPSTTATFLVAWANEQDAWIRTLAKAILDSGTPLADNDVTALYEQFCKEKQLVPGDPPAVASLTVPANEAGIGVPLQLDQIRNIQHVNALATGQAIDFNPKLTILFGENAAGKSGYVRIIKRVSNARTREQILPNLYTTPNGNPTATITYTQDGTKGTITWQNEEGLSPLNRIDVFDVRAATVHVDDDLTYTYTPGELNRFPLIQAGINKIKDLLEADITTRTNNKNPFIQHFDRAAKLYPTIESLGATTDTTALQTAATITDEERQRLTTLQTEIEALRSNTPQAQLRLATATQQQLTTIAQTIATINKLDLTALQQAQEHATKAKNEHERASKEGFAGIPIPGILQPEWKAFIEAGETYLTSTNQAEYPSPGSNCSYCQQPLAPAATDLLKKYRDYCNNTFRATLDNAQAVLRNITAPILTLNVATLQAAIKGVEANTRPTTRERLAALPSQLAAVHEALNAQHATGLPELLANAAALEGDIRTIAAETAEVIRTLEQRAEERTKALATREEELANLKARTTLQGFLPQINEYVAQAQWADKARIQARRFPIILRTLTEVAKNASEEALNKNFAQRFQEECKHLRAPNVTLDFPGRQSQVTRRKTLAANHKLNTVLSEGEQKVIALADFLAEIGLKPPAPVVFDDPITSLDYKRLQELVKRIVALSNERQVIVFTHNIWFTTELLSHYEKHLDDCSYYDLARTEQGFGIITKGTHPRADSYKSLRGRLNQNLQAARQLTGEPQAALIEKGYELLRSICEVIVETELLQGVTQRYQPNVMMTKLPQIKAAHLDHAIKTILPIFENCCRYIASHSQPLETLNVRPTVDDLDNAWKTIQAARDDYNAA